MKKTKVLFIMLIVVSFIFISCSKDSTGPDNNEDDLVLSDDAVIIDETELSELEIEGDTYTFTFEGDPPDINVGDIIVGQTGYGYLRKVTSIQIENNEIIMQTEQACLTDIIEECNISGSVQFDINNRGLINGWEIKKLAEGVSIGRGGINLNDVVLYSGNVNGVNIDATIPNGYIEFEPSLNHELDISLFQIQHLMISAEGNMQFDCDLELEVSAPINYNDDVTIAEFVSPIFMIGPVPCIFELSFVAGFETELNLSGTVGSGFDSDASIEFGAEYFDDEGWNEIWEKSFNFNQHPIEWGYNGNAMTRGYLKPQLSLLVASIAGPYMETEPYLKFDGEVTPPNWQWEFLGGVNGNLGFEVEILSFSLADFSINLINWETTIASDSGTITNLPPNPPNNPSPSDNATSVSIITDISWDCTDPEDDPLIYDVYFGTSSNPPLFEQGWDQTTFDLDELIPEETYYWKIKAYDDHDNFTTGEIWEFATMEEGSTPTDYVAYYPFNGNANDESGNGNNGTTFGDVQSTGDRFGNPNSAYEFDGEDDYIIIQESDDFIFPNGLTISLWCKTTREDAEEDIIYFRDEGQTNDPLILIRHQGDGGLFDRFDIRGTSSHIRDIQTEIIPENSWAHIVMTLNRTTNEVLKLYADNSLESIITESNIGVLDFSNLGGGDSGIRIGCRPLNELHFIGDIDDIRIYNRALTEEEIDTLYHEGGWDE